MNHPYLDAIASPISPDVADCSEDNEFYAFLDDEMVKFGTLREQDLNWQGAEEAAVTLLKNHCKNMRVLAHLTVCLQQSRDGERYVLSIKLINVFLKTHWETSQPLMNSPERSLMFKRKILNQILQRTIQFASKLDLTEGDQALVSELASDVKALEENSSAIGFKSESFWRISNDFKKGLPEERAIPVAEKPKSVQPEMEHGSDQKKKNIAPTMQKSTQQVVIPELHFDASNEREVKQTLFKVATLLNSTAVSEPLGYRIRRYALWLNITSLPAEKKNGTTEMMAVSNDRIIEYKEALKNNPSDALLHSIEHSVAASPFWLSGSYLSSCVAKALGHEDISDAIWNETLRFTKRLPGLLQSKFSDGTKFADEATCQWLRTGGDNATLAHGTAGAWGEKLQSALKIAKEGQYKDAMMLLEKGASNAEQPRDQFYWHLATADFMESTGMKSIAKEEYRSLLAKTEALTVHAWEPTLLELLRQKSEISDIGSDELPVETQKDS